MLLRGPLGGEKEIWRSERCLKVAKSNGSGEGRLGKQTAERTSGGVTLLLTDMRVGREG